MVRKATCRSICEFISASVRCVYINITTCHVFQSYDFILSRNGQHVAEDVNPGTHKLQLVSDGYILHNVSGIRTHIVSRLDGKGYDVTKRTNIF